METSLFLLIEIILLGLFLFGMISGIIYNCYEEKTVSSFFIGILGILVFGGVPAWGLYINLNKYLTKPKPTNVMETCIGEKTYLVYQDTIHLCYPSNKNSTCFTSIMSMDGETRQTDTCTICRSSFLDHDTHREHRYYETVSCMNESLNYCYNPKSDNNIFLANLDSSNEFDANGINWDNVRKIDVLRPKKQFVRLSFLYFCFSRFNYNFTHNNY